jgi:hypothetical protein
MPDSKENQHPPDLQEIHDFLIDLAAEAGKVITSSLPTIDSSDSKKNSKLEDSQEYHHSNKHLQARTWSLNMTRLWRAWSLRD